MKDHPNLSAYNDVENLERFTDESFNNYCNSKLLECEPQTAFISRNCVDVHWEGKVCEIGSGNSKLLYSMEKNNILQKGIGYEINQSRYLFSERFKELVKSEYVQNVNNNFLKEVPLHDFDIVIGVDIVFQFIEPLYQAAEQDALTWIYNSLRSGGYLLLELRDFKEFNEQIKNAKNHYLNYWEEFPEPDPFEFVLARIYYDENYYVHWEKTFLERKNGFKSKFNNILKPYRREDITKLLESAKFQSIRFFQSFSAGMQQETYIVLAQK
jgi:hypothetical protein